MKRPDPRVIRFPLRVRWPEKNYLPIILGLGS
jgi:hypothetical protein